MAGTATKPIVIPAEPCRWLNDLFMGMEIEYLPFNILGSPGAGLSRHRLSRDVVSKAAALVDSKPFSTGSEHDVMLPIGRLYCEMKEFVELAGPTCRSGEAVAWAHEAGIQILSQATVAVMGKPVVLCHLPSDYNDLVSGGAAHSDGCHPTPLTDKVEKLL